MAGYTAMSRIDRAVPRFRPSHAFLDAGELPVAVAVPDAPVELPETGRPAIQDLTGAAFAANVVDLLADIRQVFRQGLEVLADPPGWGS
jgi:hypothetical protein